MTDTTVPAASQPAPSPAQTSVEKSGNISLGELTRQFARQDLAQAAEGVAATPVAETAPDSTATSPETAPAVPAETTAEAPLIAPPEESVAETVADEALSHETSLAPELQAVIDKRIGKEVAKRKALEAELAQLRGQAAPVQPAPAQNLPPVVIAPTAEQPLANIQNHEALQKVANDTRQIKYLAQEGLDTIEATGQEGFVINDKAYSKTELRNILRNASRSLEEQIPSRQTFLQQRDNSIAQAVEKYPWMKDQNSPEFNQGLAILRNPAYAHLHYVHNGIEMVGLMIEGQKAMQARGKPVVQSKPKPAAPTKAPASQIAFGAAATGSTRAAGSSQTDAALATEMKKLSMKGGVTGRDVARYLSQKEQLTSNRS